MRPENLRSLSELLESSAKATYVSPISRRTPQNARNEKREVLPAAQWLRAVMGFEAAFGRDGLPTVWG